MNDTVSNISGIDFDDIKKTAKEELLEDRTKEVKKKYKAKLREVETASQVLRNTERELKDLEHELSQGVG